MTQILEKSRAKKITTRGFTIIELVVVITVIAILAAIVVIGYGSWRNSVAKKEVFSDLSMAASAMENAKNSANNYPTSIPSSFKSSSNVTVTYYSGDASTFCINGVSKVNPSISYYVNSTNPGNPLSGNCADGSLIADGSTMQTVTKTNCPSGRTMVVDARDNRTYWIKKLADGQCWMLTNLAYAGGGTNTYGDVITITSPADYAVPPGANPTTSPTLPSTSTNGTGQYGYLYSYCAALGAQRTTRLCDVLTGSTPPASGTITICPSGWRLPIRSGSTSEFNGLNNAINGGSTTSSSGLRTGWLAQYSGDYDGSSYTYGSQGVSGFYWIDDANSGSGGTTYGFNFTSTYVNNGVYTTTGGMKQLAVRCLAR